MSQSSSSPPAKLRSSSDGSPPLDLPLRAIPGNYGVPFFGPIKDRFDYFYNQGKDEFFKTRIQKYQSTVFRTNMPPGPFIASNPKVIVVLDAVSFPVLFDNSKVEKKDVLDGTYMPSTSFTGGYRVLCWIMARFRSCYFDLESAPGTTVLAYLDPSEAKHTILKRFISSALASQHDKFIPLFRTAMSKLLFPMLEENRLSENIKINFNDLNDVMSFDFVFRLFCDDKSPSETKLESKGPTIVTKWLFLQLAPLISGLSSKLPHFLEDLLLHTFPLPFFLVKSDYKKLYDAFYSGATSILDEAEKNFGIKRDEACHNLVFAAGFNAYGGMKTLFPVLFKWVGLAGDKLHQQLADEIRTVVKSEGGITFSSLDKMTLTKSVVYEALRIEPPVAFQYGKAKEDIVVQSHDAAFEIKKGEMIFGYQAFPTKDPKVFDNPEEFVGHRFVGEGEKLLKYLYWSNGRETEDPTVHNKQCPGKDLVVLLSRVVLVEFFLRYDTFTVEAKTVLLAASVTFTSLTKASYN